MDFSCYAKKPSRYAVPTDNIKMERSAQIRVVAKKIVTRMVQNYNYVFYFLLIMFILCYWFDQKTGIKFTGYFYFY